MAGKSPQPSYEPPFQAEGTLGATHASLERERGAQSWGKSWPRTNKVLRYPTKTAGKGECQASWPAIPVIVVMGVYMLWFNFILGLNFIFLCFWVW